MRREREEKANMKGMKKKRREEEQQEGEGKDKGEDFIGRRD